MSEPTLYQVIENDFKYDYDFTGHYVDGTFVGHDGSNGTHRLVPVEPTELYYIDRSHPEEKGWAYAHIDSNGERAYTEGFGVLTRLGGPA